MKNIDDFLTSIIGNLDQVGELAPEKVSALLTHVAAVLSALAAYMLQQPDARHADDDLSNVGRLLTVEQAAERLCFTIQYLYELIRKGQFPSIRQGKYVRIPLSDLSAWIDEHRDKGLDKQLCQWHNNSNETIRTSATKKETRSHPGSNGRQDRHNLKRFGTSGTRRAEDLGTHRPTGQIPGSDRIEG